MRLFIHSRQRLAIASSAGLLGILLASTAFGQVTLLGGWEDANELSDNFTSSSPPGPTVANGGLQPNGQGTTPLNGRATLPLSPTGRWLAKDANGGGSPPIQLGEDVRLSRSTTIGVVPTDPDFPGSTGALKITHGGSNRGGSTSHYNFAAAGLYLYDNFGEDPVNSPVLLGDPRGEALRDARDNPSDFRFEFDVTFDVETMIERDPVSDEITNWQDQFPFFEVGLYMSAGIDPGNNNWIANNVLDLTGDGGANILSGDQRFDFASADPSDAPGSMPVEPITKHVAIKFPNASWPTLMENGTGSLFQTPDVTIGGETAPISAMAVGFVINGNWEFGSVDNPDSAQSVYIDNLKLVNVDPTQEALKLIDFNNDEVADIADWQTFLDNHLLPPDTYPAGVDTPDDLTCGTCWWDKGDVDHNGTNDFKDYVAFIENFNIANASAAGSGSQTPFELMLAGVPEPSAVVLLSIGAVGLGLIRRRHVRRPAVVLLLLAAAAPNTAEAQLLESWEAPLNLNGWTQVSNGAGDAVAVSTSQSSDGSQSLAITRGPQLTEDNVDIAFKQWSTGDPAFDALANAVNLGTELFRLKADVIYNAVELSNSAISNVGVSMFIGSNQGNVRLGDTLLTQLAPWNAGDGNVTATIDLPLSDWAPPGGHLGDVEADGNGLYQMQIGLTGVQDPGSPATTVYIDNLRLEQVADPDFLTLNVNRTSGDVSISNTSGVSIDLSYYEIRSAAGGLIPANWNSLDDQEGDDPIGEGWDQAGPGGANPNTLVETKLLTPLNTETVVADNETLPLGNIYDTTLDSKDLVFQYRNTDRPNKLIGSPPGGTPGDYNQNGVVDAADYTVWRDALGSDNSLPNDDSGGVGEDDYDRWKANFGNVGGGDNPVDFLVVYTPAVGGGGVASVGSPVPEPSTLLAGLVGLTWLGLGRRGRSIRRI